MYDRRRMISRAPCPALRPFVSKVWASDERAARGGRERVLPTGGMHLVFRFSAPLRVFEREDDPSGRVIGHAIVGGARASAYLRDTSQPVSSVGAQLLPGASALLLGVPALALAERHTPLEDLWGAAARELHARLAETVEPARRLALFEALLAARLPRVRGVHPAVTCALARFAEGATVGTIVGETGYSHRGFTTLFEREVGLSPKRFQRVQRLQRALAAASHGEPWARIAIEHGYADQSHLHRELRELGGLTPSAYARAAPRFASHVPIELPIPPRPRAPRGPRWRAEEDDER
jgi:AraC-like DNA-binding protein